MRGHFPPKSNDDCLPCFLYKSFFNKEHALYTAVEWCRAGGQGQVLVSTLLRAQNRAAKGSTLLRRQSTLPTYSRYVIYLCSTQAGRRNPPPGLYNTFIVTICACVNHLQICADSINSLCGHSQQIPTIKPVLGTKYASPLHESLNFLPSGEAIVLYCTVYS